MRFRRFEIILSIVLLCHDVRFFPKVINLCLQAKRGR